MRCNAKKSITIKNRSNYFNPLKDRAYNTFASPTSYQFYQSKIEGYENRLYWEFRYCNDHRGATYFYTLTYNDKHVPKYCGQNCFDYNDLRYMTIGPFAKQLLRKYGTVFKYFIGAELGDGKGERGMHNNPHYHVLFFLRSANNSRYPYREITPIEFRHLVREYWQGFDEDTDGPQDYREAKFGIAKEGENLGLVTDFRACMYCAKYVTKDVNLKKYEEKIKFQLENKYKEKAILDLSIKRDFLYDIIYEKFNIPTNCTCIPEERKWMYNEREMFEILCPKRYNMYKSTFETLVDGFPIELVDEIIDECHLYADYNDYVNLVVQRRVDEALNEYRNRYCNKCRISHGVGDYALQFIEDKLDPKITVPGKNGWKQRPIGMYYYRKLFTDLVHDKNGNGLRVLNELGQKYKINKLDSQINNLKEIVRANAEILTEELYEEMWSSNVNTEVNFHYSRYKQLLDSLEKDKINIEEVYEKYAEFKLVYENRFYKLTLDGDSVLHCPIDVHSDYARFIVPSYYESPYAPGRVSDFLENDCEAYMAYWSHPYFLRYVSIFAVYDLLADYLFVQTDDKNQEQASEIKRIKRFHDENKLKDFYSNFE